MIIKGIPAGTSGWTDNPVVGPDGRIYVENGAPCDACQVKGYLSSDTISFLPGGQEHQDRRDAHSRQLLFGVYARHQQSV